MGTDGGNVQLLIASIDLGVASWLEGIESRLFISVSRVTIEWGKRTLWSGLPSYDDAACSVE